MTPVSEMAAELALSITVKQYSSYLATKTAGNSGDSLNTLMDGPIRDKLKIIPKNVEYVSIVPFHDDDDRD